MRVLELLHRDKRTYDRPGAVMIDLRKAFDSVDKSKVFDILK